MFPRHSERSLKRNSKADGFEGEENGDEFNASSELSTKIEDGSVDEHELNFSHPPEQKKSRGRPQKQHWTHEWNDKATEALIELWSSKEELYNKQHPEFYVKESKDRAVGEIKHSLNQRGFNVTESNILSKFQSLRTYFCTQRTKFASTKKTNSRYSIGCAGAEEGESKWRFYKSLMFLDDNMKQRDGSQRKQSEYKCEYDGMAPPSFSLRSMVNIEQPFRDYDPTPDFLNDAHDLNGIHNNNSIDSSVSDHTRLIDHNNISPSTGATGGNNTGVSMTPDMNSAKQKNEDLLFGELVGNMIHQLPAGQHKDMIKLEIQQLIIKAKYASTQPTHDAV